MKHPHSDPFNTESDQNVARKAESPRLGIKEIVDCQSIEEQAPLNKAEASFSSPKSGRSA